MRVEVIVGDHQSKISIPERLLTSLEGAGEKAAERILAGEAIGEEVPLSTLTCVVAALVDY
ncbi:MAG: hypothetical protein AAGB14_16215 [Verrucomicrobiota bacterium]